MPKRRRPAEFTFLGVALFIAGFATLLSIAASWHFGLVIHWQLYAYAAMNFLLSYGFFRAQYWLPLALGLNWVVGGLFAAAKLYQGNAPAPLSLYVLSFCLAGVCWFAAYRVRGELRQGNASRLVGGAFVLLWATIIVDTAVGLLQ